MTEPNDLGLPAKFTGWRTHQWESIQDVAASEKYAYLLDSPTGTGKSLTGAAVQKLADRKVVYLTGTKQLQDQLLEDFDYARLLKGRANYPCARHESQFLLPVESRITADDCPGRRCPHCIYKAAKAVAAASPLAVLNYAYFMAEANSAGEFDGRMMVCDECDSIEDWLMADISVAITQKQIGYLGLPMPKYKTKFEAWIEWAKEVLPKIEKEILCIQNDNRDEGIDIQELRRMKQLERLYSKLRFFIRNVDDTWVWYPEETRWEFKPVWVSRYAKGRLWNHADKVLCMSATILDPKQYAKDVGLEGMGWRYRRLPSPFPVKHRPVYYEPVANLTSSTMNGELPKICRRVDQLLTKHGDQKVLIHTASYDVARHLMQNLGHQRRLMTHETAADRVPQLEAFKESRDPMVMISPSMDRGVDLYDDLCRAVIVVKMPFAYLGDPQIQRRRFGAKDGSRWYAVKTIRTVIQMLGRGVRSKDDWCDGYILDEQFERLYQQNPDVFPSDFKAALITS